MAGFLPDKLPTLESNTSVTILPYVKERRLMIQLTDKQNPIHIVQVPAREARQLAADLIAALDTLNYHRETNKP